MRALVTGGAGFIGSHLCERLLNEGFEVFALDNLDPYYDPAIKRRNLESIVDRADFTLVEGDLRDNAALEQVFDRRPTVVFHLAALAGVRPSIREPARYMDVNLVGTARLLEQCVQRRVRRLVFASSSSVYGNRKDVPFRETDPVDDPVSPYAASKKGGELLCHTFHHLYDMDVSCLRLFTVYGPRQRPEMAIHAFVRSILSREPITVFGDGSSSRDYTFVDDVIDGIWGAFNRLDGFQIFNLGEATPITLSELIETIESVTGRSAKRHTLPPQPGDVERTFACIDRAREELGYAPRTGIQEGIARFVEWYEATR